MSSEVDVITLITYICGVLGLILLLLCIILAIIFIYSICRPNSVPFRQRGGARAGNYALVPSDGQGHAAENGQAVVSKDPVPLVHLTTFDDEEEIRADAMYQKRQHYNKSSAAPIKKKLLWRRKKKKSYDDFKFSEEELNTPREPLYKKHKKISIISQPRSRSAWDLHDLPSSSRYGLDPSELRDVIRLGPLQENDDAELGKSQYFDALETITETAEEELQQKQNHGQEQPKSETVTVKKFPFKLFGKKKEPVSSKEDEIWIDLEENEEGDEDFEIANENNERDKAKEEIKRFEIQRHPKVRKRINALKCLMLTSKYVEAKFYQDLDELEQVYLRDHHQKILDKRNQLINGANDANMEEGASNDPNAGIPGFWLNAMLHCEMLKDIVQCHDAPVLIHLQDIQLHYLNSDTPGFQLEFHFSPNKYFDNAKLTKTYFLRCHPNPEDPLAYDGPEIISCQGCKILWNKKAMNVTLKQINQMKNGHLVQKSVKQNSFFNFFTPPKVPESSTTDMETLLLLEAHFEIGMFIKETFITKAGLYFLGEGQSEERKSKKLKAKRKISLEDKVSIKEEEQQISRNMTQEQHKEKPKEVVEILEKAVTEFELPGEKKDTDSVVEVPEVPKSEADEVETEKGPDPIIGRYRMTSSENFDEFMKALNVGYMKRKMANSVTPVNVIEIDAEGTYTIRTETTLRTTEIKFKLDESFDEPTLDGRTTKTIPTRIGNKLILDQRGDKSKKEKDSIMTRDFHGDRFFMEIIVDDIVCKRIYDRITDNE